MPTKMHSNKNSKLTSFGLKTLSAAVLSAMLMINANAAGLGKITVLSALGQPLRAEIELNSVAPGELGTLVPKLAPPDAYQQANIEFQPALLTLRFAVDQRGGKQFIRVTSTQPINEPFMDMLLELGGSSGRLMREYTFLLDPADLRTSHSAAVAPAIPAGVSTSNSSTVATVPQAQQAPMVSPAAVERTPLPAPEPTPASRAATTPSAGSDDSATADSYTVKNGDALYKIAARMKPAGISLDQMLVALYRSNPNAFSGNNMNRLRAGQILSLPDAEAAGSVSNKAEAKKLVLAQAADFNSYRNRLAGRAAESAPQTSAEPKQSATGKINAKVEEQPTAVNESADKLKLSRSGAASGKNAGATTEERIAKDKALAEANSRVKDLEKNVAELQKLLQIKNQDLAAQQHQNNAAHVAPKNAAPAAPVAPVVAAPVVAAPVAPAAEVKTSQPEPQKQEVAPAVAVPKPVHVKPKVVAPTPKPQVAESDDSTLLYGGAGLLILLIGAGWFLIRRKRQDQHFEDSIITDSSLKANSLFGSTGGQSVDTNNSVFNSSFAPSVNQLDSNEVDPVAEADVYIAYGRDAQAEEILKEALRTQPERNAVRLKLLEIYANRKDTRSFETLASELYSLTKGEGDDWTQAATLGISVDPDNPLYAAGKDNALTQSTAATLMASTQQLDEPDLDALLDLTQPAASVGKNAPETLPDFRNTSAHAHTATIQPGANTIQGKAQSSDLDFDLEGLNSLGVPHTIPRPQQEEPTLDIGDINFDFLTEAHPIEDEAEAKVDTPEIHAEATELPELEMPETVAPELPAASSFELGEINPIEATPAEVPHVAATKPEAAELDLSGITLELDPTHTNSALVQEAYVAHDTGNEDYSSSAEMSTKLDLAVAYQEIGDKEGARELLDEVVKGGSSEQSEKAKNLLLKLA